MKRLTGGKAREEQMADLGDGHNLVAMICYIEAFAHYAACLVRNCGARARGHHQVTKLVAERCCGHLKTLRVPAELRWSFAGGSRLSD